MQKFTLSILSSALLLGLSSQAFANNSEDLTAFTEQQCTALKDVKIRNTEIKSVEWNESGKVPADKFSAFTGGAVKDITAKAHCIVNGEIGARTGADGNHYGTQFQLRLPHEWNGKFLFQGGGGADGFVAPAVGSVPMHTTSAQPALVRGYAVVSMDGGHPKPDSTFGLDQQARLDYAYQSIGKVVDVAKQLVESAYNKAPKHSYFMGCSNGGREAMIAAQRYPTEFDGVVASNAGFRLSRAGIAEQYENQLLMKIAPKNEKGEKIFANAFTQEDLDKVSKAVLAQCDAKDGLKDGIINAWESCDFNPDTLDLPKEKIDTLKAMYAGVKDSKGNQLYSGWFFDAGINQPNWRAWKLGDSQTTEPNANNMVLAKGSMLYYFLTPAQPNKDLMQFDIDKDSVQTFETGALNDAVSTDLSTFKANGGKLIITTGVSDPVFSAMDQRDWFRKLQQDTQGTDDFARFFALPGMTHCGDGNGVDDVDPLTALEQWQDEGKAPDSLLGKSTTYPNKEIPVCAYPKVATYIGGDENKAESFECR